MRRVSALRFADPVVSDWYDCEVPLLRLRPFSVGEGLCILNGEGSEPRGVTPEPVLAGRRLIRIPHPRLGEWGFSASTRVPPAGRTRGRDGPSGRR